MCLDLGKYQEKKILVLGKFYGKKKFEALRCREILSWLRNLKVSKAQKESDSLRLVSALKGPSCFSGALGLVLQDCKYLLERLPSSSPAFIIRKRNDVAHN